MVDTIERRRQGKKVKQSDLASVGRRLSVCQTRHVANRESCIVKRQVGVGEIQIWSHRRPPIYRS